MALLGLFRGKPAPVRSAREQAIRNSCNRRLDGLDQRRRRLSRSVFKRREQAIHRDCDRRLDALEREQSRKQEQRLRREERQREVQERRREREEARATARETARWERKLRAVEAWEAKHGRPHPSRQNPQEDDMASKKFLKLERHVAREYEEEGYGPARANYIGRAVAGQVARKRDARDNPSGDDLKWFVGGAAALALGGWGVSRFIDHLARWEGITETTVVYDAYGRLISTTADDPAAMNKYRDPRWPRTPSNAIGDISGTQGMPPGGHPTSCGGSGQGCHCGGKCSSCQATALGGAAQSNLYYGPWPSAKKTPPNLGSAVNNLPDRYVQAGSYGL